MAESETAKPAPADRMTEIHIKNQLGGEFIYAVRNRDVAMATLAGLVSRYGVFPVIKDEHGDHIELDLRLRLITLHNDQHTEGL